MTRTLWSSEKSLEEFRRVWLQMKIAKKNVINWTGRSRTAHEMNSRSGQSPRFSLLIPRQFAPDHRRFHDNQLNRSLDRIRNYRVFSTFWCRRFIWIALNFSRIVLLSTSLDNPAVAFGNMHHWRIFTDEYRPTRIIVFLEVQNEVLKPFGFDFWEKLWKIKFWTFVNKSKSGKFKKSKGTKVITLSF